MNHTISRLLRGEADNHLLPFFWQHGEDEAVLRDYVAAIEQANCRAFCVESRPHPDFCGPLWWRDLDIILDEARKRGMQVWILDDSHFPTGYANGALEGKPDRLCRQQVICRFLITTETGGMFRLNLREADLLELPEREMNIYERMHMKPPARVFDDDHILSISAIGQDTGELVELTDLLHGDLLSWDKPQGVYTLQVLTLTRNSGSRRDYINMLDRESCLILIDAVYEPHWQRYQADFGKTIAGFFSDEPEFGNGSLYTMGNLLGSEQDLPWSTEVESELAKRLGSDYALRLPLLWRDGEATETAHVRFVYMDIITKLVRETFSYMLGTWCRDHGVQYIGHIIEDDGQHCRTGSSLGHYFRSLEGQDMAGIDDIGGQVLPQGEDEPRLNRYQRPRNGEFYHYGLAKLAQSAAAIEPHKKGRAMCEIFGNYGWDSGVRMQKYLADHFLVRGINYFVPHAFSPKTFPDPDCPPHFYAHGHNPQFRHFCELMAYMNRVATLTSSGRHDCPVAVLYHGEAEWSDNSAMPFEKVVRALYDHQIDSHVIPSDVFEETEFYNTSLDEPFMVNGQHYRAVVVPAADYLTRAAAEGLATLHRAGVPVYFAERRPLGVSSDKQPLPQVLRACPLVTLDLLADVISDLGIVAPKPDPASDRVRILRVEGDTPMYYMVNEAATAYSGRIRFAETGSCYLYDPWNNQLFEAGTSQESEGTYLTIKLEPLKSFVLVFDRLPEHLHVPLQPGGSELELAPWRRAICESIDYPQFGEAVAVDLPDMLAAEQTRFSGFVRYCSSFELSSTKNLLLEIEDAGEVVEVFVNDRSLGIQVAPPFCYELVDVLVPGTNTLVIEVATTLERACYPLLEGYRKLLAPQPSALSGLTGRVHLYQKA